MKKLMYGLLQAVGLLVIGGAALGGPHTRGSGGILVADSSWDLVVLGRIDFCLVCQFGPSPHVRYTLVLAGHVPSGQAQGQPALAAVDEQLLPEGGVPIYKSQRDELCFLKKVVVPGYEGTEVYRVVDVKEATPENLAAFRGR
jgi:hypothetical protein